MAKKKKKFLAVYLGSDSGKNHKKWEALDKKTRDARQKAGVIGWMKWVNKNEKKIVDGGAPVGKTKLVNKKGVSNTKNMIVAYTIVEAKSHQAAANLFKSHPHFTIFPGDSVEVMECLSLPG